MGKGADPVSPQVTFDNYVIPDTVQRETKLRPQARPVAQAQAALPITGMMGAVTAIAVLTFLLGVMATLKFAQVPDEALPVAETLPEPAPKPIARQAVAPRPMPESGPPSPQAVTRQQTPDLTSPAPASEPEAAPALQAAVLKGLKPERTVRKLTRDELTLRSLEAQAIVNRNKLRMLREGVLAGVYSVEAHVDNGIRRLVLTTVNAEMTRASMGNLLLEAAAKGELQIPKSLSTANGSIDMDTMLFNLIQTSLMNDGTPEGAEAAIEMSRRAFAKSDAKTRQVKGQRVYVVQPGDSLAYISLQFYGRPNAYDRIFEANRETLKSPDLIRIGQRLIIPG